MGEPGFVVQSTETLAFSAAASQTVYDDVASPPPTPKASESVAIVDQQGQFRNTASPVPLQQLDVLRECAAACRRDSEVKGRKFANNQLEMEDDPFRFYDASWKTRNAQFNVEFRPPAHRRASLPSIPEEEPEFAQPPRPASEPPEQDPNQMKSISEPLYADPEPELAPEIVVPKATHPDYAFVELLSHPATPTEPRYQSGYELEPPELIKGRRRGSGDSKLNLLSGPAYASLNLSGTNILTEKSTSFHREFPLAIDGASPVFEPPEKEIVQSPVDEKRRYLLDPFSETNTPKARRRSASPNSKHSLSESGEIDQYEPTELEIDESSKSLRVCFSPPSTPRHTSPLPPSSPRFFAHPFASPQLSHPLSSPNLPSPHLPSPHFPSPRFSSPHIASPHLSSPIFSAPHNTSPRPVSAL